MKLVLICGQGQIGKTTYGLKMIKKYKNKAILISMDNCYKDSQDWDLRWKEYVKRIQSAINSNRYFYIFCDMSQDAPLVRFKTLKNLCGLDKIDLVILQLRPPLEQLLKWRPEEYKQQTINNYFGFVFATTEEFRYHQYNSISIYTIDNINNKCIDGDSNYTEWLI